jgi:hypothetical protein
MFEIEVSGRAGKLIVGAAVAVFGLVFSVYSGWAKLAEARERAAFATAAGVLTSFEPAIRHATRGGKNRGGPPAYEPVGAYEFSVDGSTQRGTRFSAFAEVRLRAEEERALRAAFDSRSPITVRYDAADPGINHLELPEYEERIKSAARTMGLIGVGFAVVGIAVLTSGLRRRG